MELNARTPNSGMQSIFLSGLSAPKFEPESPQAALPLPSRSVLVAIDPQVKNYDVLLTGVHPGARVAVLAPDRDGIEQITALLKFLPSSRHLHVLCHGSPGCLNLGSTQLNLAILEQYETVLRSWFSSRANPALVIYGSRVAAGAAGAKLTAALHRVTGASVMASSLSVGHTSLGGCWEFDVVLGEPVPLAIAPSAQMAYDGLLSF
ncbi:MAG: DUF4347 domain-containing protein [Elainellaceae cyanobacterium]